MGETRFPSWVVLHVPHDSTVVPDEVRGQFVLSDEALRYELVRMTDHLTFALFAKPAAGATVVRSPVSRLIVDVERFADDAREPMAARGMGAVYASTSQGAPLRRQLSADEREAMLRAWYRPHHRRFETAVSRALDASGRCLVIDCHSFPSVALPYEQAAPGAERPEVCIGTDGFHTDERLAGAFVSAFEAAGFRVARDTPFSGAIVPASRYRLDARVAAVMVEVNRGLYCDEANGTALPGFHSVALRVRAACLDAISRAAEGDSVTRAELIDPREFDPAMPELLFSGALRAAVDAAVEDAQAGRVDSAAGARLAAALGAGRDGDGPWSVPDLFDRFSCEWVIALSALSRLDDDSLCERWADEIGEDGEITDALRAEYVRDLVCSDRVGYECEHALSSVLAVPLKASDGRTAVLGGTAAQQGNIGFKLEWWGVFRDETELLTALEAWGRYALGRVAELPDATLLEAWDR